jgi:hypothetical protein
VSNKDEKLAEHPEKTEALEKIKRAVAIQNIGEKNLEITKITETKVSDEVVDDPTFWDYEQRKLISRELRKLRDASKPNIKPAPFMTGIMAGGGEQALEALEELEAEGER